MYAAADKYARVAELSDRIEAEMRRIGFWCKDPPTRSRWAIREWDGDDRAAEVTTMLCDLDRLIEPG